MGPRSIAKLVPVTPISLWFMILMIIVLVCISIHLVGGFNPSEKYEFVSWDDDIPNLWKNNRNVPNQQPAINS